MEKINEMNILITGVGGPTPRSIARSIKISPKFKHASLIGTDSNPLAYGLYQSELYSKTYVVPIADSEKYWEVLEDIIDKHKIDLALIHPEMEVALWAERERITGTIPVKALLPDSSVARSLVSKSEMSNILEGEDFIPKSYAFSPSDLDIDYLESILPYPFWIRSSSGSSGLGSLLIQDRTSILTWISINPNVTEFIASEYLPGRNLACKLLYWKGKLVRAASGERVHYIMAKVAPSGITGNTSFGRLLNEPALVDKADKVMQRIFLYNQSLPHGFYTADFKEAKGNAFITEINVRMVAFNHAFAVAGANFTEDIIQLLHDDSQFDMAYKMYGFEPGTIFLRDVDVEPMIMNENELLK
jgi:carbamoyl-phosphate synthase large subunit